MSTKTKHPVEVRDLGDAKRLVDALDSNDRKERLLARREIVSLGSTAVPFLIDALSRPQRRLRWEATKALRRIADPASAPALVRALDDEDRAVRWLAAEALVAIGPQALVPALRGLLHHSGSVGFRAAAHHVLRGLEDMGVRQDLAPVLRALESSVSDCRAPITALKALSALAPRTQDHPDHPARARHGGQPQPDRKPMIALAEDDDEMRQMLTALLEARGYRVLECRDGFELLHLLDSGLFAEPGEELPDLIISDVRMPGVTGLSALESVRGRPGVPPALLITAFGDDELHDRARLAGVEVLDKPFELEDLLAQVQKLLSPTVRAPRAGHTRCP
jgi:CheY-like chemotaxis protein